MANKTEIPLPAGRGIKLWGNLFSAISVCSMVIFMHFF